MDEGESPSRRERERERHRSEILAAAEQILGERGLDGLTMDEIARRSEFAVGSLYRFFGSKEDLVEALIASHVDALADETVALTADPAGFDELLDRFFAFHTAEVQRTIPLIQFLFSRARPLLPAEASPLRVAAERFVDALAGLMRRGIDEEVLVGDEPATMAVVLLSLLDGLVRSAWLTGRIDFAQVLPIARRAFFDGHRRR